MARRHQRVAVSTGARREQTALQKRAWQPPSPAPTPTAPVRTTPPLVELVAGEYYNAARVVNGRRGDFIVITLRLARTPTGVTAFPRVSSKTNTVRVPVLTAAFDDAPGPTFSTLSFPRFRTWLFQTVVTNDNELTITLVSPTFKPLVNSHYQS